MIRRGAPVHEDPGPRRGHTGLPRLLTQVEGITGRYFVNRKPKTSSKASYDTVAAARLWQASAELVGMHSTA